MADEVGSAWIEVHARAAASLEREIQSSVDAAAEKIRPTTTTTGSPIDPHESDLLASIIAQKDATEEASLVAGNFAASKRRGAAAAKEMSDAEKVASQWTKALGAEQAAANRATAQFRTTLGQTRGALGALGSTEAARGLGVFASVLNPTALALTALGGAAAFAGSSLREFLKAGDEGKLTSEEQIEDYRALSADIALLSERWRDAKLASGGFLAGLANDVVDQHRKSLATLRNPLGALADLHGIGSESAKDYRDAIASIDNEKAAKTTAEYARAQKELAERAEVANKAIDKQVAATVALAAADFEAFTAQERVNDAQDKVRAAQDAINESRSKGVDRLREIREAEQALADQRQSSLEADRAVAEARRNLTEAQFRSGAGSQAALDAAEDLQEAEHDAARAKQEVADSESDVAKARRESTEEAKKLAADLKTAEEGVESAQRAQAASKAELTIKYREATGVTTSATDALRIHLEELEKIPVKGPAIRAEIDAINRSIALMPQARGATTDPTAAFQGAIDAAVAGAAPSGGPSVRSIPVTGAPVTINMAEKADPLHIAEEIAWRSGRRAI